MRKITIEEKYIKDNKLPKDFVFSNNVIIATTEDDYIFICREDLLGILYNPGRHLEEL